MSTHKQAQTFRWPHLIGMHADEAMVWIRRDWAPFKFYVNVYKEPIQETGRTHLLEFCPYRVRVLYDAKNKVCRVPVME